VFVKSDDVAHNLYHFVPVCADDNSSPPTDRLGETHGTEPEKLTRCYWRLLPKEQKAKCAEARAANFEKLEQLFDAWLPEQARAAQTARMQRASLCADVPSRPRRRPAAWLRRPSRL
jgi:hypothetical protein